MIFDICGCGPEKLKFRAKLMISMAISIGKMINSLIWNVSDTPMSGIMRQMTKVRDMLKLLLADVDAGVDMSRKRLMGFLPLSGQHGLVLPRIQLHTHL